MVLLFSCNNEITDPPTMEEMEESKNNIENSFDNIAEYVSEFSAELLNGFISLQKFIDKDFGWFSSDDLHQNKINTVENMEDNLANCKSIFKELNEEISDLNHESENYFNLLNRNLQLQSSDLRQIQEENISEVNAKFLKLYENTVELIEELNEQLVKYEGIIAYLRGDVALELIETRAFKELDQIVQHSNELIDKITENTQKNKNLISEF